MTVKHKASIGRILLGSLILLGIFIMIIPKSKPQTMTDHAPDKSKPISQVKPVMHTITLTSSGFEPKSITIKKGEVVVWTNNSGKEASVNSADHPTHKLFPILNLGSFDDGQNLQTKIYRTGELHYVNHLNPSQTGTIIVK